MMTAYFLGSSSAAIMVIAPLNENNLGAILLLPLHLFLAVSVTFSDIASANFLRTGRISAASSMGMITAPPGTWRENITTIALARSSKHWKQELLTKDFCLTLCHTTIQEGLWL